LEDKPPAPGGLGSEAWNYTSVLPSIPIPNTQTEVPLWWLSSAGPHVCSVQGIESEAVVEGMPTPLEKPEPSDAFDGAPWMIGLMAKKCWSLAENQELGS